MKKILLAILLLTTPAFAAGDAVPPPENEWSHQGTFGTFDRAALQRGYQVYKEVCASCHSLKLLSYRNLEALGFSPEQVKALAAEDTVIDIDDEGEEYERPAKPSDRFKAPYANDKIAAAVNNGAAPPDLSLIIKSRTSGEDYMVALLTGYKDAPADAELLDGQYWNTYFPGHTLSMAPPLSDGQIIYADGTEATVKMAARDVAQFLAWASEPHMEARKAAGLKVIFYLLVFAGVLYAVKRKVWAKLH